MEIKNIYIAGERNMREDGMSEKVVGVKTKERERERIARSRDERERVCEVEKRRKNHEGMRTFYVKAFARVRERERKKKSSFLHTKNFLPTRERQREEKIPNEFSIIDSLTLYEYCTLQVLFITNFERSFKTLL